MGFTLKGLFQGKVKDVLDSTFKGLDDLITNKEELAKIKLEAEKELNRHAEAIEEAYLNDVANSRETNVKIQESDKSSWMAKNVGYIIDLTILIAFLGCLVLIVYKVVPEQNKELFYMAFGSLGTFAATSINWHRGSSQGSADKQRFLDKMMKK